MVFDVFDENRPPRLAQTLIEDRCHGPEVGDLQLVCPVCGDVYIRCWELDYDAGDPEDRENTVVTKHLDVRGGVHSILFKGECGVSWEMWFAFHKGNTFAGIRNLGGCYREQHDSYVYFIEAPDLNRIKIGKAVDPEKRLATLQVGSPVQLKLIAKIPGGCSLERELHDAFSDARLDGEWFTFTKDIQDYIKQEGMECQS